MPYGMKGGDTPEKTAWMERCVEKVMKRGNSKQSAIRICKATHATAEHLDRGGR